MGLFWKIFCSMVTITALACAVGGYVLIDAQFRASLEREAAALYEENDLLRYTLARELAGEVVTDRQGLSRLVGEIGITTARGTVAFRVSDGAGAAVAVKGSIPLEAAPLIDKLPEGLRGWRLAAWGERTYLHGATPLLFGEGVFYLENCREVTTLFTARQEQYRGFFYLMLALTAFAGVLSLLVTAVMLRPLARLSAATKRMAEGELNHRVKVESNDELGRLSADFNAMAARLEEQVAQLTDAARRQEDFIGSFAHEIKTPLTSIIGYGELLRSRPVTQSQLRESAGYIFTEGRRLEALSQKLMDLIVLEKSDFSLRPVDMEGWLPSIAGMLRPALEQEGIRLRVRAAAGVVSMEPDLMETVCLNLLDNARKAIDGGGLILLEGVAEDDGYCVHVTDNGKGIPADELGRVTEPFYMADKSRARAKGGAGLGLALCQRIVTLHGGRLEFQSIEGAGTRVSVHLKGGDSP